MKETDNFKLFLLLYDSAVDTAYYRYLFFLTNFPLYFCYPHAPLKTGFIAYLQVIISALAGFLLG
jgi:hypothetical protein